MKIGAFVAAAALVLPALPVLADPVSLSGDALKNAISGKTVYLNVSGFELPIHYLPNGRMTGRINAIAAGATSVGGDGSSDNGKWWVENDQLCQRWTSWLDGKSYCFKLTREGNTVNWLRNDGDSGTARIGG